MNQMCSWVRIVAFRQLLPALPRIRAGCRPLSSTSQAPDDFEEMLKESSWSVKSLFESKGSAPAPAITKKQLHHLLRLSALPLPESEDQEARMIKDLQSHLKFVRAIQEVDTEGVEPLQSIRDETRDAERENEITVTTLQEEFNKEEVVGRRGRIRRRMNVPNAARDEQANDWDPLSQAPKKLGRFIVVDTAKD